MGIWTFLRYSCSLSGLFLSQKEKVLSAATFCTHNPVRLLPCGCQVATEANPPAGGVCSQPMFWDVEVGPGEKQCVGCARQRLRAGLWGPQRVSSGLGPGQWTLERSAWRSPDPNN